MSPPVCKGGRFFNGLLSVFWEPFRHKSTKKERDEKEVMPVKLSN